jgi:peptide/nickel transport system substrate-binding protein
MYFNVNGEPFFRDVNFRNALSFAVDRQRIIDIVFAGKAAPAQGQYSPNTLFYDPSIKRFGPRADVARAKQLLDRVQTKPNRPISMLLAGTDTLTSSTATILQANWRAIGVELQIEVLDLSAAVAKFVARNFDLFMVVDFLGTGPGWTPTYMFSSYDRGAIFNFADPNPQVERLVETARSGLDRQAVKQALSDLQRYDIEQQMTIAICHPHYLEAQGVPLSGYQPMPLGNLPFTVEDARIG